MAVRVCAALWAAVLSASALAQPRSFTIEEAYRVAEEAHPSARTAESRPAAGQAELREANAFLWNNPSLSLGGTQRTAPEPAVQFAAGAASAAPLTLEEAWRLAEERNPALRTAQAARHAAEGQLAEARAPLWNNPGVSLEGTRTRIRQAPADNNTGWRTGLSQTFELAGQQGYRREAAETELAAIEASIADTRIQLRAEVEQRFVHVLALQLRAQVERETVSIIEQAAAAMRKRLDAGEVSRLDSNLARVEAERARNSLTQLDEQLTQARAELASALQLPPAELPEVAGELERRPAYGLEDLLDAASKRQQLVSLARREQAARSRLELERAMRYPDLTLGLFSGRDGPPDLRENIVGLNISLPLPLFRRNQAGIGQAVTELTQVQIERRFAEREAPAAVRAQWQRLSQLEARAARLRESVLPTLEENRRLSQIALKEGELGIADLILVNRQVAEVRRELLEAEAELRRARIAVERAAGWQPADMKGSQ